MKNLFIASALLISASVQAQFMTLDKKYSTVVTYTEVVGTGYYASVSSAGIINMYLAYNHGLSKTIIVPTVSGYSFVGAYYITDRFFDNDDPIEYLAAYKSADNKYLMNIVSESGIVLDNLPNAKSVYMLPKTQYGIKMMVTCESLGVESTSVYSFARTTAPVDPSNPTVPTPITPTSLSNARIANVNPPFPNPTSNSIQLNYSLQQGQTGELIVTDILGNVAANYKIGSDFDYIVVNVGDLVAGTYSYYVKASDGVQAGKTFIVQ